MAIVTDRSSRALRFALVAALCATPAAATSGGEVGQVQRIFMEEKLLADDGAASDTFGTALAMDGDVALIGALGNAGTGSAYLYDTITREEIRKLTPVDGAPGDYFGAAVALDGDRAVVGAWRSADNGTDSGLAYVFDTATGQQLFELAPDDPAIGHRFGGAVAIAGTTVVVGARGDASLGTNTGAVYLFDATTGLQTAKLMASDASPSALFGIAVAISGSTIVVGAQGDGELGASVGAAYLFDAVTEVELHKLTPTQFESFAQFGAAVAIDGTTVLVGALFGTSGLQGRGSAYLFDATTGNQLHHLEPPDLDSGDRFGYAVGLSDDVAVIGAGHVLTLPSSAEVDRGGAYLFDTVTGKQLSKLYRGYESLDDRFGGAVAIEGSTVLVGAALAPDNGPDAGSVFVFEASPTVALRNAGTNPDSFRSSAAWMGGELEFTVDLTTTGHTHAYIIGLDSPAEIPLGAGQTLLCFEFLGYGPLIASGFHEGPIVSVDIPFPASTLGLGLEVYTQAVHAFGTVPFALSNSQDLVVGGSELPRTRPLLSGSDEYDAFGFSVAVSGTTAVVGAPINSWMASGAGEAHVIDTSCGTLLRTLTPSDGEDEDRFGYAVAISGSLAVVGATQHDDIGAVYVFDINTGAELNKLVPDESIHSGFGRSVAISGTKIVVGARVSAYVFDALTGAQITKVSQPTTGSAFGDSVDISGNVFIVGAWTDDEIATSAGSVYLFDATTGDELHRLFASNPVAHDFLGVSVGIDGPLAVAGAYGRDVSGSSSAGAVFVFDVATGAELWTLTADDPASFANMGQSVDIHGTTVLAGAPELDSAGGTEAGAVYVFDAATGTQLERVIPHTADKFDGFGLSVAASADAMIAGAVQAGVTAGLLNAAYLF